MIRRFFQPDSAPTFKFSLMQLLYWGVYCSFYNYCVAYFTSPEGLNISASQAGFAVSAAFFASIIGRVFWGIISDSRNTRRKLVIGMVLLQWVTIMLFALRLNSVLIVLCMAAVGFMMFPIPPVLDAWTINRIEQQKSQGKKPMSYSFVRLWSSALSAVFCLCLGNFIEQFGYSVIFVGATLFTVLCLFFVWITGDVGSSSTRPNILQDFKKLFRQKSYILFLLACLFMGVAWHSVGSFMSLIMRSVGGSEADLGLMLMMATLGEVPLMFISPWLHKKLGARNCFFLVLGFNIIQFTLFILASSPIMACIAQMVGGFSYGLFLPTLRLYSAQCAAPELRTSALSITDGVFSGAAAMIGAMIGGVMIECWGVPVFATVGLCLILVSFAMFLLLRKAASAN